MDRDDLIIKQLMNQEEAGLQLLMERYGDMVLRTAYLLTRDHMLAEDISQETFLLAYQKAGQYQGTGKLKNWLLKIAINLCRAHMRKASWKRLFFRDIQADEIISGEHGPEKRIEEQELVSSVKKLPYKYREVVILYYYHDLSIKEISLLTKEKEGTIRSKLSRGRGFLREMLEKEGWQDA